MQKTVFHKLLFEKTTPGMFRLFLSILVILYHSTAFVAIGHYAVYVFFVLSGYWIFKMYNEKYRFYKKSYLVYIRSRLFRLLPIYFIILFISAIVFFMVSNAGGDFNYKKHDMLPIFLTNIFLMGINRSPILFNGPAWSLEIEIQFYLIAPILLNLCLHKKKSSLVILGIVSLIAILFMYVASFVFHYQNVFIYMPFFLMGGIIYIKNIRFSEKIAMACIIAILLILIVIYGVPVIRKEYILNKQPLDFSLWNSLNILFTILTIPFLTINVVYKPSKENNRDHLWSSMSYVIYLLHWPLMLIYSLFIVHVTLFQKSIYLIIFYLSSWFLSMFVSIYVDFKIERKRRHWLKRQPLKQMSLSFAE